MKSRVSHRSVFAAFFAVLLFSFPHDASASDPYETVYFLPEESVEAKADLFVAEKEKGYLCGRYGLGIGVTDYLSFMYSFDYIHSYFGKSGVTGPGDSRTCVRWYTGGTSSFYSSFTVGLTLPTGGNMYTSVEWAGLSFGNYELYAGPSFRYDFDKLVLSGAGRYTFRQGKDEKFFNSRFFDGSRLANDYMSGSASVMSLHLYPCTAFCSIATSVRVWKRTTSRDRIPADGCGIIPVPFSAGVRWFFVRDFYASVYLTEQLRKYHGYLRRAAGCSVSVLF